ncbi:hypothetical protein EOI86_10195 [Hwanghaeella grinnelliae]|uniref:Uncharacterized protein n=1 Tax=Hwanghaeella grinnelliae TaxID=2500179 RepID=A0A3S2WD02_9PROT|nr:hypothetical protein [Hwanghaeella grinnelliae]RVU39572.1 hypothetical protein EOI86_10195 [Hwanghaeella grinnelliae]
MRKKSSVEAMVETVRLIFAGEFDRGKKDVHYSQIFYEYVSAYSAHCRHRIKSGTRFVTEVYKNGSFEDRYETAVETEFVDSFKKHDRIRSDALTAASVGAIGRTLSQSNPFDFGSIVNVVAEREFRAKIMEMNVQPHCDNASGMTMHENFRRFEFGLKPLKNENAQRMMQAL